MASASYDFLPVCRKAAGVAAAWDAPACGGTGVYPISSAGGSVSGCPVTCTGHSIRPKSSWVPLACTEDCHHAQQHTCTAQASQ